MPSFGIFIVRQRLFVSLRLPLPSLQFSIMHRLHSRRRDLPDKREFWFVQVGTGVQRQHQQETKIPFLCRFYKVLQIVPHMYQYSEGSLAVCPDRHKIRSRAVLEDSCNRYDSCMEFRSPTYTVVRVLHERMLGEVIYIQPF